MDEVVRVLIGLLHAYLWLVAGFGVLMVVLLGYAALAGPRRMDP